MKTVVGIRFRPCGKIIYYDPQDLDIRLDDGVVIDTDKGEEFGVVAQPRSQMPDVLVPYDPQPIIRVADDADWEMHEKLLLKEREARAVFVEKVREHDLKMKLVDVECSFDGNRIIFYFSADGRVDFRDLVRDLAADLHLRIELRQIGVRDETRMLGGMGPCGRPLCCNLYLREFAPVTIKMAKSQNLSLNPTKISGCCGRLMCCLRNEAETYEEMSKNLPKRGTVVTTNDGFVGVTMDSNILAQTVRVIVDLDNDEKEVREYALDQLKFTPGVKRPVRKADQRPAVRSVVAQAAQAEARRQAQIEEEARAEEEAKKRAEAEEGGDAPAGEGGRRRRRPRRRRAKAEGGEEARESRGGSEQREEAAEGSQNSRRGNDAAGEGHSRSRRRRRRPEGGESRGNRENEQERGGTAGRDHTAGENGGSRREDRQRRNNDRGRANSAGKGSSGDQQNAAAEQGRTEGSARRPRFRRRRGSGSGHNNGSGGGRAQETHSDNR